MPALRVGIDVTPLRYARTGVGYYLANLLRELQARPDVDLAYFTGSQWVTRLTAQQTAGAPRPLPVRFISTALGQLGAPGLLVKDMFNRLYVRRMFNSFPPSGLDLVHGTNYQVHGATVPEIVTVFDLSCFRHPETHPPARVAFQKRHLPVALKAAAHIITISEFSRAEIVGYFGVAPERITVTHCAAGPRFRPHAAAELDAPLRELQLVPGRYVLTVGTIEPRKNLVTLVRAHALLPPELQRRHPLVIAGMQGWMTAQFDALARGAVAAGTVRLLGYVPDESLPFLYAGAALFAYPSLYEGFGLPPLEALASGTATLVSDCSSLPEVVGDAARRVAPLDVEQWHAELRALLERENERAGLAALGPDRARQFSWRRMAAQTIDVYRAVT